MGCCCSCRSASTFDGVRVVHINGYVEVYPEPVTPREVAGEPRRQLLCFSPTQLLSAAPRPLGLDERLDPGRLYFLLPLSVFHSDSSPVDLAALVTRLTGLAGKTGSGVPTKAASESKLTFPNKGPVTSAVDGRADTGSPRKLELGRPRGVQSWKPVLCTIEERSLGANPQKG